MRGKYNSWYFPELRICSAGIWKKPNSYEFPLGIPGGSAFFPLWLQLDYTLWRSHNCLYEGWDFCDLTTH